MRVVVFGYHDVGCACLKALLDLGQDIPMVVTHRDDPGENIWFGSVAAMAMSHGIRVETPDDVNAPASIEGIRAVKPDAFLSCYFRHLLSPALLGIPPKGAYNMHGSLLPQYRGRAPVNWVLVRGESETGVTLHHMTEKPDRGDIVGQVRIPITDEDTALSLHAKSAAAAGDLVRELWPLVEAGTAPRIPQDPSRASYFGRRRPEDGRIDWSRPARICWNLVRAVTHPYPGAFTMAGGRKLYIWRAALVEPKEELGHRSGDAPAGARESVERAMPSRNGPRSGPNAPSVSDLPLAGGSAPGRGPKARVSASSAGTIVAVRPGRGFLVATGEGDLLVESAQLEGDEERPAQDLIRSGALSIGQRLG